MFDIDGILVSLDFVEKFFCCDLDTCLGACCIEGDAGAPITDDERKIIEQILPHIWDDLLPRAQEEIKENGVAYRDPEGELVTQIVDGKNCAHAPSRRPIAPGASLGESPSRATSIPRGSSSTPTAPSSTTTGGKSASAPRCSAVARACASTSSCGSHSSTDSARPGTTNSWPTASSTSSSTSPDWHPMTSNHGTRPARAALYAATHICSAIPLFPLPWQGRGEGRG